MKIPTITLVVSVALFVTGQPSIAQDQFDRDYGTAADGDLLVTTIQAVNPSTELINDHGAGSSELLVADTSSFAVGDEIMIIQLQGDSAGRFEFARVQSTTTGSFTLQSPLSYGYLSGMGSDHAAAVRVPNYDTVTIADGGVLTTDGWIGTQGGVLALRAATSVTVEPNGSIDVSFLGYRGGNQVDGDSTRYGYQGESYRGPGVSDWHRNDSGGGGCYEQVGCCTEGAGGGGCGTAGDPGQDGTASGPGEGGGVYAQGPSYLLFGAGGGAGIQSSGARAGGSGAGAILIFSPAITCSGPVAADGGAGASASWGGAGGGAGGSIWLVADTVDLGVGQVGALGGAGGVGGGYPNNTNGGDGGAGRVFVAADTITGASDPEVQQIYFDGLAPTITAMTPEPGSVATLVYEITLVFSEPIASASLDGTVQLVGDLTGSWDVTIEYERDTNTAYLRPIHALTDDGYTLIVSDSIIDTLDTPLDGEFMGAFPSGDGSPGGDFAVTFTVSGNQVVTIDGTVHYTEPQSFQSLYVSPTGSLTADAPVTVVADFTIAPGGNVTHSSEPLNEAGLILSVGGRLNVQGTIDVTGAGLIGGLGSGSGQAYDESGTIISGAGGGRVGAGGSYGGSGAPGDEGPQTNAPYGLLEWPEHLGSGGGGGDDFYDSRGGSGGGRIYIEASTLRVDGSIVASGVTPGVGHSSGYPGGGSGGAILVVADVIEGEGTIVSNGGAGGEYTGCGGSGGGGRIALYYDSLGLSESQLSAAGGQRDRPGSAGTIYLMENTQQFGHLIIKNDGIASVAATYLRHAPSTYMDMMILDPCRTVLLPGYLHAHGNLNLAGGSVEAVESLSLVLDGTLTGNGSIGSELVNASIVSPGSSPGEISVASNLICTPESTLEFELAGLTPVVEHDVLNVTGAAAFDGTLRLQLIDGYAPQHLDHFRIITYGSASGRFAAVDADALPAPLEWRIVYGLDGLEVWVLDPIIIKPDETGTFPTIQDAVDALPSGTPIELTGGVFTGAGNVNVDFGGADFVITGNDSVPSVIECENQHRAFYLHSGETTATLIERITIRNGSVDDTKSVGGGLGGGILCDGASPLLRDIVFESNSATTGGGGLHLGSSGGAAVSDCIFEGNGSGAGGGGFHLDLASDAMIVDCIFTGNGSGEGGGGMHLSQCSNVLIEGCTFSNNGSGTGGGGFHLEQTSATLTRSTIVGNEAPVGAGIDLVDNSTLTADLCIIADNLIGEAVACDGTSTAEFACTDIHGNDGGDWVGCIASGLGMDGNISVDPSFCADGYELRSDSPCADANNSECGTMGAWEIGCDNVPLQAAPGDDIGALIGGMENGDILEMADGIYTVEGDTGLVIPDKAITIRSVGNQPGGCIIDLSTGARGADRNIRIAAGSGQGPKLERLVIRGGFATRGGAISCDADAKLTLARCIFTENVASEFGGALYVESGEVLVRNCTFFGNTAPAGSGIYAADGLSLSLYRSIVAFGGIGAGVEIEGSYVEPPICCDFFGNEGGDWENQMTGFDLVLHNFAADPQLIAPENGDFQPNDGSPCSILGNADCGQIGALPAPGDPLATDPGEGDDEEIPEITPDALRLHGVYPNPFNPSTTIRFDLPHPQRVKLAVYALDGRRVALLLNRGMSAGRHGVIWNGRDGRGRVMASGVYVARLETEQRVLAVKMALLK